MATIKGLPTRAQLLSSNRKAQKTMGQKAVEIIRARTKAGRAYDGSNFPAYTPEYAAKRAGAGLQVTPNLTISGELLKDLSVLRLDGEARVIIGWRGTHRGRRLTAVSRVKQVLDAAGGTHAVTVFSRVRAAIDSNGSLIRRDAFTGPVQKKGLKIQRYRVTKSGAEGITPYEGMVRGLSRKFRFFGIRLAEEVTLLAQAYKAALGADLMANAPARSSSVAA